MDFHKPYFSPLDEGFHNTYHQSSAAPSLEKPIFSAREIGTTVAESLGQGNNVLQNIDSAIKLGTSTMQIALMTPHTAAMGGRMKAYGKEAREQIREVAKAANIKITGVEMPTSSMNNLSGYDPRSKSVSKEAQRSSMDEVRDALHFIAEVGGGGGVDVFSQEFTRGISEANQWGDQKVNFAPHEGAEKEMIGQIVDTKTGEILGGIPKNIEQVAFEYVKTDDGKFYKDKDGNPITKLEDFHKRMIKRKVKTDEHGRTVYAQGITPEFEFDDRGRSTVITRKLDYDSLKDEVEWFSKNTGNKDIRVEEYFIQEQEARKLDEIERSIQNQDDSRDFTEERRDRYHQQWKQYETFVEQAKERGVDQNIKQQLGMLDASDNEIILRLEQSANNAKNRFNDSTQKLLEVDNQIAILRAQKDETVENFGQRTSLHKFAKSKSIEAYAQLGIEAMQIQKQMADKVDHDLYVGPELGWPTAWGGHPREFTELVVESREKMAQELVKKGHTQKEAKELAKRHIKGCFDTSHLGMWYDYMDFEKEGLKDASKEQKLEKFNEWFMQEVDHMQKNEVIGSIQAVDAITGSHAHLPPGQGVFPVVDAVRHLKEQGWEGPIVSEGHEEDSIGLGRGRIQLEAWKAFGADFGMGSYHSGTGQSSIHDSWTDISGSYFGRTNPPNYIFGSYAPDPQEWVFWSGVPLE